MLACVQFGLTIFHKTLPNDASFALLLVKTPVARNVNSVNKEYNTDVHA
jgi:hypothetical protein